jgi:hypothetical protein
MLSIIDTPYVTFEIKGDVLHATYKKGIKITLDIARQVVEARLKLTLDRNFAVLIYNQGVISMDKPARDFLASPEGTRGVKAAAMMLDSAFSSFLGNFYLSVNKPPMPVRIFTNTKSALGWLQKFVDK